jgi:tetratricopeptide (TPR) repeat protein
LHDRLGQKDESREYMEQFRKLKVEEMKALKARDNAFSDLANVRKNVAQTHTSIGQFYHVHRNARKAEQLLRRAAMLDPRDPECHIRLASLYHATGRLTQALKVLEQLYRIEPTNPVHRVKAGIISAQLQRFDDSEKAFEKAIKCAPKQSIGYRELARLYLNMGRKLPDARKYAEKAVTLEPIAENYFVLGCAYYRNSDAESAISAMERAIELEPNNVMYKQTYEYIKKEN